jgi:hypothetical protein
MRYLIVLFVGVVFAGIGYIVGFLSLGQERVQYFTNYGVLTYGKVLAKQPDDRHTVVYTYAVEGFEFTAVGHAGQGNSEFEEIQSGQKVIVFFDPEEPSDSFLGDPRPIAIANERIIFKLTLLVPLIPITISILVLFLLRRIKAS